MTLSNNDIEFVKYHGAGNDFILMDNRNEVFPYQVVRDLCQRRLSVGADGVILLENSSFADYRMRIFNADGSEAEMCGNGARCFYRFLQELGLVDGSVRVETVERIIELKADGDAVAVSMGAATDLRWGLELECSGKTWTLQHLNTGVPHVVCFVEDPEHCDVQGIGSALRYHEEFAPKGVNVNFVGPSQPLELRTYERGVEAETLACGTGATAAALAAAEIFDLESPVQVRVASGDLLSISFDSEDGLYAHVWMSGPVERVYAGRLSLPAASSVATGFAWPAMDSVPLSTKV